MNQEQLQEKVQELAGLLLAEREHLAILQELLASASEEKYAEVREIEELIRGLRSDADELILDIRRKNVELVEEIDKTTKAVQRREAALKDFLHSLPQALLQTTQTLQVDAGEVAVQIRVSKAEFETIYRTEALLKDHPELEEYGLDGDPLVGRTIVPEVFERLLTLGELEIPNLDRYRQVVKKRNPSVSIDIVRKG